MAINVGVGTSKNSDARLAASEAYRAAIMRSGADHADVVIAFSSPSYDQTEFVRSIREVSGGAPLFGCSDAGEITNDGPMKRSAAVMVIASDSVRFHTGLGLAVAKGAREAGRAAAQTVRNEAREPIRVFAMLPDVLAGSGSEIVAGALEVLGPHFPVVGGAPGDDFLFEKTWVYSNDAVESGAVSALGMAGKFSFGVGVGHGWIPLGMPLTVTRSVGPVLYELDGKPALSVYEEYFGRSADELRKETLARIAITYPIGLHMPEYPDQYLIRDPLRADAQGAITCTGDVPEGSKVRIMIGSRKHAMEAARSAAEHVMQDLAEDHAHPKFVLMFNSVAREKLYGRKANDEIQTVLGVIGRDIPLIGFYTYGELAPIGGEVRDTNRCNSSFHNETVVLFAVGE